MASLTQRLLRTAASYVPSKSLLGLRNLKDLPARLLHRPHDRDFLPLGCSTLSNPVILDVGANRGQSIESFRAMLPNCTIHAVEPNPVLSHSLTRRYPGVTVYPLALGASAGEFTLHIPRYGHTYWDTRASLDKQAAREFLCAPNFLAFDVRRAHVIALTVPVQTLDSLSLSPDVIKIDAEGLEPQILSGAAVTLEGAPVVMVEGSDQRVMDILMPCGYAPFHADGDRLKPGTGRYNTYFLTEPHQQYFTLE